MLPIVIALVIAGAPAGPAQDASALATKLLDAGAASFNAKDAAGLAATYTDDAQVSLLSQENDTFEERSYEGRAQIQKLYSDLFSNAGSIQSKNIVEYARLVGPNLLLIAGTFEPDLAGSTTLQFVQIRILQSDGTWKIRDLRLLPIPQS